MTITNLISKDDDLLIEINGRIDSGNSKEFEEKVLGIIDEHPGLTVTFDAQKLSYISSAGLRVFMKAKRAAHTEIYIINVNPDVWSILETTGFLRLLKAKKAMRHIDLESIKPVGTSINGRTYKLPGDEIVKVYKKNVPLSEIQTEREIAQEAMILGVPTAIPYDVVSCGNQGHYGLIYEEMSGAITLAEAISKNPDRLKEYAAMLGSAVRLIHSIEVDGDVLPNIKTRYKSWLLHFSGNLSVNDFDMLNRLIAAMPERNTYVNGDIRIDNLMVLDDELIFSDMAASGYGHPIFDLQGLYASLVELEKERPYYSGTVYKLSSAQCKQIWEEFFKVYMGGSNQDTFQKMNVLLKQYHVLTKTLAKSNL